MKKKLTSLILAAAMVTSMLPAARAAAYGGEIPDEFMLDVGLPLMEARTSGLYDQPEVPLPEPDGEDFLVQVEGGGPYMPGEGKLMAEVTALTEEATPIGTAAELAAITEPGNYVLTADIDLTGVVWTPVDIYNTAYTNMFRLDGQGHVIKGLSLTVTSAENAGLFGRIYCSAEFKDLRIEDVTITTAVESMGDVSYVFYGGLVGRVAQEQYRPADLTLDNVTADNVRFIRGGTYAGGFGGLAGEVTYGSMTARDCAVDVTVLKADPELAEVDAQGFAGLAGYASDIQLERCYARVDIDVSNATWKGSAARCTDGVAGLVASFSNTNKASFLKDCLVEGTLTAQGKLCGGLVAESSSAVEVDNCVVRADLTGMEVGGMIADGSGTTTMKNCRYSGEIRASGEKVCAGGLGGTVYKLQATGCAVKTTIHAAQAEGDCANIGGITGYSTKPTITGCAADVTLAPLSGGNLNLGGIAGQMDSWDVFLTDCFAKLTAKTVEIVYAGEEDVHIGALVGKTHGYQAENCGSELSLKVNSQVNENIYLGGQVGWIYGYSQMVKCYGTGTMSVAGSGNHELGGLIGRSKGSSVNADWSAAVGQCYGGVDITLKEGNYAKLGGLVGSGNYTLYSSWSDAELTGSYESTSYAGGLVGNGSGTLRDCAFVGTMDEMTTTYQGGLVALGTGITVNNCYVQTDLLGAASAAGGLIGRAHGAENAVSDCWYRGTIKASGYVGGIAGYVADGSIQRCSAEATLSFDGPYYDNGVGGILGASGGEVSDCQFTGSLDGSMGAYLGGIVGISTGSIYDCTAKAGFSGEASYIGGIAGRAALVWNCHAQTPIYYSAAEDGYAYYIGGIAGDGGTIVDCTSAGVSFRHMYVPDTDEHYSGDPSIYVGGIAGNSPDRIENCRVNGEINVDVYDGSYIKVGGLAGAAGAVTIKNSVVSEDVSASFRDGQLEIGGLLGSGYDTVIDASYHSGKVKYSSWGTAGAIAAEHPLVGNNDFLQANVPSLDVPDRPAEEFTITAYSYCEDPANPDYRVLGGAVVTVNDAVLGTTAEDGTLTINSKQMSSLLLNILVEKDGYFSAERVSNLAGGGKANLYLMEKQPGKIYLTSARIGQPDGTMKELLTHNNTIRVFQDEKTARSMYVGVDWNNTQEDSRQLYLTNKAGTTKVKLTPNGNTTLMLGSRFQPKEDIYLEAMALDLDGKELVQTRLLPLKVEALNLKLELPGAQTELGGENGLYFLDGKGLQVELGDMIKLGPKIECENGVMTIEFNSSGSEASDKPLTELFPGDKMKVSLDGVFKIPYSEVAMDKWSGTVRVAINRELESSAADVEEGDDGGSAVLSWVYHHIYPPAVPTVFKLDLSAGLEGSVGMEGTYEEPKYMAEMGGEGKATVFIGLGREFDKDVEITGGGEGELTLAVPFKITAEDGVSWNPSVQGTLAAKFTFKAGEVVDIGVEAKLGGFVWDKDNGARWLNETESTAWKATQRDYLSVGGGFVGSDTSPVVYSWQGGTSTQEAQPNQRLLYENILSDSRAAMALENGAAVLYFTADDETEGVDGTAAQHTALWRTQQLADGSWDTPCVISGSENGYPAMPNADGTAVVWVESQQTDSLDALLTSTDIKVMFNGEITAFDGGGYVYAPKVAVSSDGTRALVTWLADSTVSAANFLPTAPTMYSVLYQNGAWGEVLQVNTNGILPASTTPVWSGTSPYIYWMGEDEALYRQYGTNFASRSKVSSGLKDAATDGTYTVSVNEAEELEIYSSSKVVATIRPGRAMMGTPLMLRENSKNSYVIWAQSDGIYWAGSSEQWATVHRLTEQTGMAERLTGVIVDGEPVVSYYRTDLTQGEGVTNLYSAVAPDLSGVDLTLTGLSCDDADLAAAGLLAITGTVTNERKSETSGYTYTVTDENGKAVYSGMGIAELGWKETDDFRAIFAPDVTAEHTYTVTMSPIGAEDLDESNNTASVALYTDGKIIASDFISNVSSGVDLESMVQNTGTVMLNELTLEVYRADMSGQAVGEALAVQTYTDVLPGAYRQVVLKNVESNVYYTVMMKQGDTVLDSDFMMWQESKATMVWISDVEVGVDAAEVTITAQNLTQEAQLHLAVYEEDSGRMVCHTMQNVTVAPDADAVELPLPQNLEQGTYRYAAFLLDGELKPMCEKASDTVIIP